MDAHDTEGTDGHFELTQGAADHLRGLRDRASVLQAIDLYAWRRFEKRVERWRLAGCKREERADGGSYKRTRPDAATFYLENKRTKPNDVPFYLENMDRDPCDVSDEFMDTISGDQLGLGGVPFAGDLEQWRASFGFHQWPEGWAGPKLTQACLFRMTPHEKIFADATSTKLKVGAQVEYSLKAQILMHMHGQYKSTGGRGSRHRVADPNVPEHDVWTNVIPYPMGYVSPFTNAPWPPNTVAEALMPLISEAYRAGLMTAAGGFPDIVATAAPLPSQAVQRAAVAAAFGPEAHLAALQQVAQAAATPQVTTPSGLTVDVDVPTEDPIPQLDNWEERSRQMVRAPSADVAEAFRTEIVVPVSTTNPRNTLDMYRVGGGFGNAEIGILSTEEFQSLGGISDGGLLYRTDNLWRARGLDYRHFMRQRVPSRAVGDARALVQYPAERAVSLDALVVTHNSRHYHLGREDGTRRLLPHLGQNEAYWAARPGLNDDSRRRLEIGLGQAPLTNFDVFLRDLIERPRFIQDMRKQALDSATFGTHRRSIETLFPKFVSRIGTTHELLLPKMQLMNTLVTIVTKARPGGRWTGDRDVDHVDPEAKQGWVVLPYSPENGITLPAYDVFVRHIIKYRGPSREYQEPVFSNGRQESGATNAQYRESVVLGHVNTKLFEGTLNHLNRTEYEQGYPAHLVYHWRSLWMTFVFFWRASGEDGGPYRMMGRAAINPNNGNGLTQYRPHEPFQEGTPVSERSDRRWFDVWGNPRRLSAERNDEFAGVPLPSQYGMEAAIAQGSDAARAIAMNAQAPDGLRYSMGERLFNDATRFATLMHPEDAYRIENPTGAFIPPTEVRVSARALSALFLQEQLRRPHTQRVDSDGYMLPVWPSAADHYEGQCGPLLAALHRPRPDHASRSQFENSSNPAKWEPVSYSDPWFVEDPVRPAVPGSLGANREHVYKSGVLLQLAQATDHRRHATQCLEKLADDERTRQRELEERMDGERRRPPRPVDPEAERLGALADRVQAASERADRDYATEDEEDYMEEDAPQQPPPNQIVQRDGGGGPPTLNLRYAYLGDPRDPDAPGHGGQPPSSDSSGDEDNSESEGSDAEEHARPFEARSARDRRSALGV